MPSARRIFDSERHAHFVTFPCYKRRRLLDHDDAKRVVLGTLNAQLERLAARCAGFVIMPDHVHALLWFPQAGQLAECLKQWKRMSSYRISKLLATTLSSYGNAIVGDDEPIWQSRYHDFNVTTMAKAEEKLRYMHLNPVRAGLVERAVDWPWSSARHYETGKSVGVPIQLIG